MKTTFKQKLQNTGYKFAGWLTTRYGVDRLSTFLLFGGLVIMLIGRIARMTVIYYLGDAMAIFSIIRTYSPRTKTAKRQKELAWFDKNFGGISKFFSLQQKRLTDRSHKYFRCRTCGQMLRVPRGQANIVITCSGCGSKIKAKS